MNFGLAQIDFQFDGFIHYGHLLYGDNGCQAADGGVLDGVAVALSVGALD